MMLSFNRFINEAVESEKIDRSAFLYMAPKGDEKQFAQCGTCTLFLPTKQRCGIYHKDDRVVANASCGLYISGEPKDNQPITNVVTPEESGYYKGQVRCENCSWFDGESTCELYVELNENLSDVFDLDIKVEPKGCCNAFQK